MSDRLIAEAATCTTNTREEHDTPSSGFESLLSAAADVPVRRHDIPTLIHGVRPQDRHWISINYVEV